MTLQFYNVLFLPRAGVTKPLRHSGSWSHVDFYHHSSAPGNHYQSVTVRESSLPSLPYRVRVTQLFWEQWPNSLSPAPKEGPPSSHTGFLAGTSGALILV